MAAAALPCSESAKRIINANYSLWHFNSEATTEDEVAVLGSARGRTTQQVQPSTG